MREGKGVKLIAEKETERENEHESLKNTKMSFLNNVL